MVEGVDDVDRKRVLAGQKRGGLKAVRRTDAGAEGFAVEGDGCGLKDLPKVDDSAAGCFAQNKGGLVAERAGLAGEFGRGKVVQVCKLNRFAKGIGARGREGNRPGLRLQRLPRRRNL